MFDLEYDDVHTDSDWHLKALHCWMTTQGVSMVFLELAYQPFGLIKNTAFDDKVYAAHVPYIVERVGVHHNHVSKLAGLQAAQVMFAKWLMSA